MHFVNKIILPFSTAINIFKTSSLFAHCIFRYRLRSEAAFKAAAETNIFLEINSMPSRLDLNDVNAYLTRELGVALVIDTDAHGTKGLETIAFGVGIARRAWCRKLDIINAVPLPELLNRLKRREVSQ